MRRKLWLIWKLYRVPINALMCGEWKAPIYLWLSLWRDAARHHPG